jgi:hypothetical protein
MMEPQRQSSINSQCTEAHRIAKEGSATSQTFPARLCDAAPGVRSDQEVGASQITKALQQLDSVIQQNSASAEKMASTAEELSSQAESLQSSIAFFQVDAICPKGHGQGRNAPPRHENRRPSLPRKTRANRSPSQPSHPRGAQPRTSIPTRTTMDSRPLWSRRRDQGPARAA